jgi:hypothetical protein
MAVRLAKNCTLLQDRYLTTPGTWVRNGLDSFIKNMAVTGETPVAAAKAYIVAAKSINDYDHIVRELYKETGKFPATILSKRSWKDNKMTYERFMYLHKFFNDAVAGGEATVYKKQNRVIQQNYMNSLIKAGNVTSEAAQQIQLKRDLTISQAGRSTP